MFGTIEWVINYRRRRRYASALNVVLGRQATTSERRRATRGYFMRTRCDKLYYLTFDRMSKLDVVSRFSIGNQDLLDDALAGGRGVYIALAHQGDHHILGLLLVQRGYRLAGVRDRDEGPLRRYVQERLDRLFPEIPRPRILFSDTFPREMYRALQGGSVLVSLMDVARVRAEHQKMEDVRVFGRKRQFVSGPLRIALRCKCPVLQAFLVPRDDFRYHFEIVEMLLDPQTMEDEESAVGRALETYAANVERFMREHPELISRL
jgi:predicted LPLAT superfamily acyltransferase